MSGQGYEELIVLNRKLDELIYRFNSLKEEAEDLRKDNEALKMMLGEKDEQIRVLGEQYKKVKLTGALLSGGEHAGEAKRKITELVREIDRCVALLNR